MSHIRTFVAVPLSPTVVDGAAEMIQELSVGVEGVKWVAPDNLHFTVKFLGDVETSDLHEVCSAVADAVRKSAPFDVAVVGAGAFPSVRRPRTVWVGAGQGSEEFCSLHQAVDRALRKLGFRSETRKFKPHITLGRVRRGNPTLTRLSDLLSEHAATELGTAPVEEVLVYSSELKPDGPEYHVLGRGQLGG